MDALTAWLLLPCFSEQVTAVVLYHILCGPFILLMQTKPNEKKKPKPKQNKNVTKSEIRNILDSDSDCDNVQRPSAPVKSGQTSQHWSPQSMKQCAKQMLTGSGLNIYLIIFFNLSDYELTGAEDAGKMRQQRLHLIMFQS